MRLKLSPSRYEKWHDDVMWHGNSVIRSENFVRFLKGQQDDTKVSDPAGCNEEKLMYSWGYTLYICLIISGWLIQWIRSLTLMENSYNWMIVGKKINSTDNIELILLELILTPRDVTRNFEKRTFLTEMKCLNTGVSTSRNFLTTCNAVLCSLCMYYVVQFCIVILLYFWRTLLRDLLVN